MTQIRDRLDTLPAPATASVLAGVLVFAAVTAGAVLGPALLAAAACLGLVAAGAAYLFVQRCAVLIVQQLEAGRTARARLAAVERTTAMLRHDLRGALSPALLVADRLIAHREPSVQRAGETVVFAVDRAIALMVATQPNSDASIPNSAPSEITGTDSAAKLAAAPVDCAERS